MSDHQTTASVPAEWLARVVTLLNAMASEGVGMEDCADPADLMCDIADAMGHGEADDPWEAIVLALGGPANV